MSNVNCIEMNIKQEVKLNSEYRCFLESNFLGVNRLFVLFYSNAHDNAKMYKARRYYLPKSAIKSYNVIIGGKYFYDQPIDYDVKTHKEIKTLTTGQGEDYTRCCLLDYDYIKNHHRLIAVDLNRQNKLDADLQFIK